jgi:hypothetical protein
MSLTSPGDRWFAGTLPAGLPALLPFLGEKHRGLERTLDLVFDQLDLLAAETWTPTITSTTNIAATANPAGFFLRVGRCALALGTADIDTAAAGAASVYAVSLPIISNLTAAGDLVGIASAWAAGSTQTVVGTITGDATNDLAVVTFLSDTGAANLTHSFLFGYVIK